MQLLIALATAGAVLHIALAAATRGLRTAAPPRLALYGLVSLAFLAVVAAAIDASRWLEALAFIPVIGIGLMRLRPWTAPARIGFAFMAAASGLYLAYAFALTFFSGLGPPAMLISGVLLLFEAAALTLTLIYAYEGFSVLCRTRWLRRATSPPQFIAADAPFVSVHLPIYSEPPDLVRETLEALAALDYPSFEVVVVDNNTKEPALWQPVQEHCARLGARFRFFHVDPLDGFKAGACNFALAHTDPRAEVIALLDADYVVDPSFLRELTPHFRDEALAFVQTPQDYREYEGNRYLTDCLHAYAYFFAVSMPARNEDNAPIFGGTMGLIRRSVLEEIGGWDEWCITEDAEASLRILCRGYSSLYIAKSYGRGLMPFDFDAYKKQRFRWAFGGIQILRKHWRSLVPLWPRPAGDRLTGAQRRWYLAAALLWFGEPLQLAFGAFLLLGAGAYAFGAGVVARPVTEATLIFPLLFLGLGMGRFLWVLRSALGLSTRAAIGAAVSMFSLSGVVSQAAFAAVIRGDGVFLRTSKTRSHVTVVRALVSCRWESTLAALCLVVGVSILARGVVALGAALAVLCFWQAFVYGSAFATSLSAIRSARADARPARYRRAGRPVARRAVLWLPAFAGLGALAVFVALAGVASAPGVVEQLNEAALRQPPVLPQAIVVTPTPAPTIAPPPSAPPVVSPPFEPASAPPSGVTPAPSAPPGPPSAQPTPAATLPPAASARPTPAGGPPSAIPTPRATGR